MDILVKKVDKLDCDEFIIYLMFGETRTSAYLEKGEEAKNARIKDLSSTLNIDNVYYSIFSL